MARILALTLLMVAIPCAEALAQRSTTRARTPVMMKRATPSMTVEERLENLENAVQELTSEIQGLRSENDQLATNLQAARSEADAARSQVQSVQQKLDPLTAAITVSGPIVKVNILEAVMVNTESVVAESYTPGAGNIW